MKELGVNLLVAAEICFIVAAAIGGGIIGFFFVLGVCLIVDAIIIAIILDEKRQRAHLDEMFGPSYHGGKDEDF